MVEFLKTRFDSFEYSHANGIVSMEYLESSIHIEIGTKLMQIAQIASWAYCNCAT